MILGTFGAAWWYCRLGGQHCAAGECHPTMAHWVWALLMASQRVPRPPCAPYRQQANQALRGLNLQVAAGGRSEPADRGAHSATTRCVADRTRCLMSLRAECGYAGCRLPARFEMGLGRGLRPAGPRSVWGVACPPHSLCIQLCSGRLGVSGRPPFGCPCTRGWDSINPQSRLPAFLPIVMNLACVWIKAQL